MHNVLAFYEVQTVIFVMTYLQEPEYDISNIFYVGYLSRY